MNNIKGSISIKDYYEEANTSRRYYLSLIVRIRNIGILQSATFIVAYGALQKLFLYHMLPIISFFSLCITIVLGLLHWNYLKYFEDSQNYLYAFEEKFGDSNHNFCTQVEKSRDKRLGNKSRKFIILNSPFLLLGIFTLAFFLYSSILFLTGSYQ